MVDAGQLRALRDACARDPGLRQRLEQRPEDVLREYGLRLRSGASLGAAVKAILARAELTATELGAVSGGFEHVWEPMP